MEKSSGNVSGSNCKWSGLVCDLLDQIKVRLPLPDLIRFSCVCSSWRSISEDIVCRAPWLIVPFNIDRNSPAGKDHNYCRDGVLGFFSVSDGVTYGVEIPELYERRICGSSHGWLITIHSNMEMQLLHPFTRKVLKLPSFTEFPFVNGGARFSQEQGFYYELGGVESKTCAGIWDESPEEIRDTHIYKAIISTQPESSLGRPIVVCISSRLANLYFCMEGDETWRRIDCNGSEYLDVAFFKGDLYAIRRSGKVDIVKGLGVDSLATASLFTSPNKKTYETNNYLVPTGTELLQVIRFYSNWTEDDSDDCPYENRYRFTERFMVYKIDFNARKWVEVKNLEDRVLFVGSNESFSVFASDFPGCRKNCIYFSDEAKCSRFRGHDKGAYCLDDGSITKIWPIDSKYICPRPIWYAVNPGADREGSLPELKPIFRVWFFLLFLFFFLFLFLFPFFSSQKKKLSEIIHYRAIGHWVGLPVTEEE